MSKTITDCICIMSGYAQTTNYCPVHQGLTMPTPQLDKTLEELLTQIENEINDIEAYDYSGSTKEIMKMIDEIYNLGVTTTIERVEIKEIAKKLILTDESIYNYHDVEKDVDTAKKMTSAYNAGVEDFYKALSTLTPPTTNERKK